ncbi:MAG: polymorphic toxin-type HINT domain-containing protein [Bythopirellula sp.]|nr:polymorphic toxin-type HINT domain-containing protein [Bythopirellula sp.]
MKKALFVSFGIAALAIGFVSSLALGADAARSHVDTLFQEALAADQSGDRALRDRLITDVLEQDPDHKLARWHSGQVWHNGKWQPLEKIERLVASDPRWQEYRSRVEAAPDTWGGHAKLARWCRTQDLKLEEQWHWFNVLRHDAGNREALGGLGMRPYRGEYFTSEQIATYEAAEKQAKSEFNRYADILKSAMREAERSSGVERTSALRKISGIHDPAAIQAIVEVVLADAKNENRVLAKLGKKQGEKLLRQMQLAAIASLSEMPEHEATLRLLEVALYASDAQVRSDAARTLKYREPTSFVPLLMAGLAAPIEMSYAVNTLPNGQITVFEDFSETGPMAKKQHSRSSSFLTQHAITVTTDKVGVPRGGPGVPAIRRQNIGRVWSDQVRDMNNAAKQLADTQDQVAAENAMREERNSRIQEVLMAATGKELGPDAKAWWSDWKEYNELYTPEELPVYETEENYDYSRYVETPVYQREYYYLPVVEQPLQRSTRARSCFVAGTPVWTQAGTVPIENIKIGDLVLSQDPVSGELNYRPVIDFTVRPPSGTVKLGIDQETIVATRGHRFWVAGKGWQMAKFIKPGAPLVAVVGSIDVQSVEKGEDAEAFNLEVGQFHTYFVGRSRVLVHDNTCPQPTINTLPGVSPRAANKLTQAPRLALRN